jgi:hypothetical protein
MEETVVLTEPLQDKRGHLLMPDDLKAQFPAIYSVQKLGEQAVPLTKYEANNGWEWYPIEFDGKDRFYGLVFGFALEMGYFSLRELANAKREYSNGEFTNAVYRVGRYEPGETLADVRLRCEQSWRYKYMIQRGLV